MCDDKARSNISVEKLKASCIDGRKEGAAGRSLHAPSSHNLDIRADTFEHELKRLKLSKCYAMSLPVAKSMTECQ